MKIRGGFFKLFCIVLFAFGIFSNAVLAQRPAQKRAAAKNLTRGSSAVPATPVVSRAGDVTMNVDKGDSSGSGGAAAQTQAEKDAAETALANEKSMRDVYNKRIMDLKSELAQAQAEIRKGTDLKCDFDGAQLSVAEFRARVNTAQAGIDTDKDYSKAMSALATKKTELSNLQSSVSGKEGELEKIKVGAGVAIAGGVVGIGALGVTAADFIKTKMAEKKLEKGGNVCEQKYGLFR